MKFALTAEISGEILDRSEAITALSNNMSDFIANKDYGNGVEHFYVGVICVHPDFDPFFKKRRPRLTKLVKKNRITNTLMNIRNSLSMDIKLDYNESKLYSVKQLKSKILNEIIKSSTDIKRKKIKILMPINFMKIWPSLQLRVALKLNSFQLPPLFKL